MKSNESQAIQQLLTEAGYRTGDPLLIAVSGGADSLALLYQVRAAAPEARLHVAHLDHMLRAESAADARHVEEITGRLALPFHSTAVDVAALARRLGQSLEEAGRTARYAFLARVAREAGASIVAVGHHADDQAETVLLHFLRGAGPTGLRGMSPLAPLPGAPDLLLIRPLLGQIRSEIEAYCRANDLVALQDASNTDTVYLRNRLRHELLPVLESYNPQIVRHLNQLAAIAAGEDDYVAGQLDEVWPQLVIEAGPNWLCLNRRIWQTLPEALQRRALRRAVYALDNDVSDLSFRSVEQAAEIGRRERAGMEAMLAGGVTLRVDYDRLLFTAGDTAVPSDLPQLVEPVQELPVPGVVTLANDWVLTAQPAARPDDTGLVSADPWQTLIAVPSEASLVVRGRQKGERIQPLGMDGRSASLQDIMVNRKLAAGLRDHWPLVVSDDHPLWLVGHVLDHRARVTVKSARVVRLHCRREVASNA